MMTRTTKSTRIGLVVLGVFALISVGCSQSFKKFDMHFALADSVPAGETIAVDVVALGSNLAADLENISMRDYWTLNHPYRAGLMADGVLWTVDLDRANPTAVLKKTDSAYWNSKTWKSGQNLFIIANLPGVGAGPAGDPRRRTLDRDAALWDQTRIDVTVRQDGISYSPTEKSVAR